MKRATKPRRKTKPPRRVVLGVVSNRRPWPGCEDQATADERIPLLLQTPAAVRFVSYEPAPVEVAPGVTVDARVRWGAPCIAGTGVPTCVIAGRFRAGEEIGDLTADYELDRTAIEAALRWELVPRTTQRRRIARAMKGAR